MIQAYHFTGDKLRDGSTVPKIGEWLEYDGEIVMCRKGLHASLHPCDALKYAPGSYLHKVELSGEIIYSEDKIVATRRRIIATIDADDLLREYARQCAISVLHLWDAPDVVIRYLRTGDESLRERSMAATRSATRLASGAAIRAAIRAASWCIPHNIPSLIASRRASTEASWAVGITTSSPENHRRFAAMVWMAFNEAGEGE